MSPYQSTRATRVGLIAAVALLLFLLASPAAAVDHDWVNSAGGFFQQTTNWDPVGVPGSGDRAVFNLNGAYTVSFFGGNTSARMTVARDDVMLDLNNSDYVLNSTGSTSFTVGVAGPLGGTGRLTIGEGTLSAQAGLIGTGASTLAIGGAGNATVTTGGTLRFADTLAVGATRSGSITISGGGDLFGVNTNVGQDAPGTVNVTGSGSTWTNANVLVVGLSANGTLNVSGGGAVVMTHPSNLPVGSIGEGPGASGVVNIDGPGSQLVNAVGWMDVASSGHGTLHISNGGLFSSPTGRTFVADQAGSTANITVAGGGAALVTGTLSFGGGVGSLTINPGGLVQVAHAGLTRVTGVSRINLTGGTLQTGSLQLSSPSQLNWSSGTLHVTNGSVIVGPTGVLGSAVAVGAARTLRVNDVFVAGGVITATGGGDVVTSGTLIGQNFAADGSVTVSGAGSTWTTNDVTVGGFGNATLTISGGGALTSSSLNTFGVEIAGASISTSRVTVSGPGSLLDVSTIPTAQGFLRVGSRGNGRLDVLDGARVVNDFTHAHVGSETGSNGTALVDGAGSGWDVGYYLFVGSMGNGSLAITGGGTVSAAGAFVGWATGSHGSLSLNGPGSRLDVGSLTIGHNGGATVTIGSGAAVQATSTELATQGIGTGLLHLNGGTFRAGTMTTMAPAARVQYDAGTFQAGALQMTGGARITLSGGRDKVVETTALAIDLPGGSRIDLADNFMTVDYAGVSAIGDVRSAIIAAYDGGSWSGSGLGSSLANASTHGIGYAEASDLFTSFPATFAGRNVDASSVLVAYARYGDANLDGAVNLADFNRLAANFGSTGARWDDGDFDYDGAVNLQDFNRLAANFGMSASGVHAPTPADWAMLATRVPEPSTAAGVALALSMMVARRRLRTPS